MRLGVAFSPTDRSARPDDLAAAVEARGLASLSVLEHTHMPVDHAPYPGGLPEEYRRLLDPFVALAAAASATRDLQLGTSVCLVAQRDPIILAKEAASLDLLSGGRFTLGVGLGWNRPESDNHGVPWTERRAVVREKITAIRALWTEEAASFDGEHVAFGPSWSWPKPHQRPHPPILLGAGLRPRTLDDLAAVFDGWMPVGIDGIGDNLRRLRQAWSEAGRKGEPSVHVCDTQVDADSLQRLADLGVDQVSVLLPSETLDLIGPALDRYARLAEQLAAP